MAARKTRGTKDNPWPQWHRDRIRAIMLIRRLNDCVTGKITLTAIQLRAIEIVLDRMVPDLKPIKVPVRCD
jgi:hypothetical protein